MKMSNGSVPECAGHPCIHGAETKAGQGDRRALEQAPDGNFLFFPGKASLRSVNPVSLGPKAHPIY